ncbi:MAG: YciI family protein [Verrucomicrobiota bacterium]
MSTSSAKSQYLLLFRGTNWHRELSAQEIQEIMGRTNAWFDRLSREGKSKAAQPLEGEGRTISYQNGSLADGPFTESKESIGGYLLLEARDFDEAMTIARQNPMIPYGLTVEVRPVAQACPANKIASEMEAAV